MISVFLLLCATCSLLANGDVQITHPQDTNYEKFDLSSGSSRLSVGWIVTDNWPSKNDIVSYSFTLVAGANRDLVSMHDLGTLQAQDVQDNEAEFQVSNSVGTNGLYMFQVLALSDTGYTIHYSQRFKLEGMMGSKVAPDSPDLGPPSPEYRNFDGALQVDLDSASFAIPYHLQTGRAKYAPMQMQPPTKVTKTQWTRIHETSALTYFSALNPYVQQVTTVTPGWSYVLSPAHNGATPAPMPSENGGWHHPSRRLSLKPRKTTTR